MLKFISANKSEDLARMFTMCQRIEKGLEPLRTEFGDFVKNKGLEAVANSVAQNPVADPKALLNLFPNISYNNFENSTK